MLPGDIKLGVKWTTTGGWIPRVRGSCLRKMYIWGQSSRGERKNGAPRLLETGLLTQRALTDSLPG